MKWHRIIDSERPKEGAECLIFNPCDGPRVGFYYDERWYEGPFMLSVNPEWNHDWTGSISHWTLIENPDREELEEAHAHEGEWAKRTDEWPGHSSLDATLGEWPHWSEAAKSALGWQGKAPLD